MKMIYSDKILANMISLDFEELIQNLLDDGMKILSTSLRSSFSAGFVSSGLYMLVEEKMQILSANL